MSSTDTSTALPKARPIIGWPGGKTRMLKDILPLIPAHTCYCEVFFGGGAVFFAKERTYREVIITSFPQKKKCPSSTTSSARSPSTSSS